MSNTCGNCSSKALKVCSKCKIVYYCNRECQKAHWKTHKFECVERRSIDDIWERCKWKTPQNAKQKNTCVLCPNENVIEKLKDDLEIKEYQISGMCTECQGEIFIDEEQAEVDISESVPPTA
tara:strand:- start:347 stop:712 length:366 start_codon:yes stop_codon:yes gene_type:complete